MKKILIAVPTVNHQVSSEIANLFGMAHGRNFLQNKYHFSTTVMQGVRPVTAARNAIAKFFLDSDHDVLWMIDQDIVPTPDCFDLVDVDADIVAPMMPTLRASTDFDNKTYKFEFPICAVKYRDFNNQHTAEDPDLESGGVQYVDGVGFGCTLIRRHVLEDKRMWADPHFTRLDGRAKVLTEAESPPIFQYRTMPNGVTETGEDYDFCYRAKKIGYTVALHTDILVGHVRFVDLQHMLGISELIELRKDVWERRKEREREVA